MSAYGDYASNPGIAANALDAPFELRINAASPLSDRAAATIRQPSHSTLNKSGSGNRSLWEAEDDQYAHGLGSDLFQGSPYLTQTDYGSDTEYAWAKRGNLLHKSSSDSSKSNTTRWETILDLTCFILFQLRYTLVLLTPLSSLLIDPLRWINSKTLLTRVIMHVPVSFQN